MYILISHKSDNGKLLEAQLSVDTENFSFEVRSVSINDTLYSSLTLVQRWRFYAYIVKNVNNLYVQFLDKIKEMQYY